METSVKMNIDKITNVLSEQAWELQEFVDEEEAKHETLLTMSEELRDALDAIKDAIDCIDEAIENLDEATK